MKTNKAIFATLVVFALALFPKTSVSKDDSPETVVLSDTNTIILNSEVTGESASAVIAKARELDSKSSALEKHFTGKKPFYLFLDTPGGSIQAGLEMIEGLQGMDRPINTITLFAASMGFQICQNLGDRLILKNGVLMSHQAAGEFGGYFGGIHPNQIDSRYALWLDRIKELDEQTVKRTNGKQTYESYTKQYDHELWMTGAKSVAGGYADRVVRVRCDETLKGFTTHYLDYLGVRVQYDLDNCPINTTPMNVRVAAPEGKTITNELIEKIKTEFLSSFENKQKQVLPLMF